MFNFNYKGGSTFIYKIPSWIKIISILPTSVFFMSLPPSLSAVFALSALIVFLSIFSFLNGIKLREQISDIKFIRYYFVFMYAVQIAIALNKSGQFSAAVFKPSIYLIAFALKLILAMQFCSALFRSTSAVEIKEGLDFIEKRMRVFIKKLPLCKNMSQKPKYSETLSFFLNFIAQISALWEKLNFAWRARGGKEGLKKILILLPVLFSIAFKNADDKRKSLLSRQK